MQLIIQGSCLLLLQDSRTKSQGVSVTAFQSIPADERLSPAPSLLAGRLPSMDADMAQAIQLSLAGPCAVEQIVLCNLAQSALEQSMRNHGALHIKELIKHTMSGVTKAIHRGAARSSFAPC